MIIPHSASDISTLEREALEAVVNSNFVGHGSVTKQLEEAFCERIHRPYVYAVSSGSIALYLALKALDLPQGSSIALPVLTCPSVLNAIYMAGYSPCLVDIQEDLCLDVQKIPQSAQAIVAPHAYGAPLNVIALEALGIPWVEDCATSPATHSQGRLAGTSGTLAIFSLGSTKYITGGMGGVVATCHKGIAERIEDLLQYDTHVKQGQWENQMPSFISARLSDINAAIAFSQLKRLNSFLEHRAQIAELYYDILKTEPEITNLPNRIGHSYYRYIIRTQTPSAGIISQLRAKGIMASASVNPWLDQFVPSKMTFPIADRWRHHLVSLPIHLQVSLDDARHIANNLRAILAHLERGYDV